MSQPSTLKTFLWYSDGMPDALKFYKETFGDAMAISPEFLESESLFTAEFSIYGHEFIGMNTPGGEIFNSSISLAIGVDGQAEVDQIWEALTSSGGAGQCGWCTDKWGVSWQVIPFQMGHFMSNPDRAKAEQNWAVLRTMGKIDLSQFVE